MTDEAVFDAMGEGWEKSFLNAAAQEIWEGMKYVAQQSVYSSLPLSNLYQWQYNPGANHCDGCVERNGQIKTFEEWEDEGLPGSGCTNCYYNCLCDLVPVEKGNVDDKKSNEIDDDDISAQIDLNSDGKKDSAKIRELPVETEYIKLIREVLRDTKFFDTGYLPPEMQKALYEKYNKLNNDLGSSFNYEFGRVHVKRLNPGHTNDFANYLYDKKLQIGIVELNIEKYGLEKEVTPEDIKKFESSIIHEAGHHMYEIHGLEARVNDFYDKNHVEIYQNASVKEWKTMKNCKEFFASSFDRYHNSTMVVKNSIDEKVYFFIRTIYEELAEKGKK